MNRVVYIAFHDEIHSDSVNRLMDFCSKIVMEYRPEEIYFLFSSSGGSVDSGLTLYNFIIGLPQRTVMHNIGSIDSIANAIFLAADQRYAAPDSTFLLHGINWHFSAGASLSYYQMQETLSRFDAAEQVVARIIGDRSRLTPDEVRALFRLGQAKDPSFALEKGLVHEIREATMTNDAPFFTASKN